MVRTMQAARGWPASTSAFHPIHRHHAPVCHKTGTQMVNTPRHGLTLLQEEARRESQRLSKLRQAERQAFEQQEAAAQAELASRTEAELRVIEEKRGRQRQELAEQRRCVCCLPGGRRLRHTHPYFPCKAGKSRAWAQTGQTHVLV